MNTEFPRFRSAVEALDLRTPLAGWPESLLMRREGEWASFYAPFDHVNPQARVVLVGITPGLQQAGRQSSTCKPACSSDQAEVKVGRRLPG
jgi:hypothetical protein